MAQRLLFHGGSGPWGQTDKQREGRERKTERRWFSKSASQRHRYPPIGKIECGLYIGVFIAF